METTKVAGAKNAYHKKAQSDSDRISGRLQAEIPDAADQYVGDGKI